MIRTIRYSPSLLLKTFPLYMKRRRISTNLTYYGGELWWTLKNETLSYPHRYIQSSKELIEFHKYTCTPDEMLFQSILCSNDKFMPEMANSHLRYIDWSDKSPHPKIFTTADWPVLKEKIDDPEDYLFARKFDEDVDSEILDQIDGYIDAANIEKPESLIQ